jgi:hypothetical protein
MLFFKFTGNGDKQIADGQMLRTDPFALAASDAVTCFSVTVVASMVFVEV